MNKFQSPAPTGRWDTGELSPQGMLRFAVQWARLAPSGHNRQPWRFRLGPDYVDLLTDGTRVLPILDPDERELTMSCGVALFYLRLALRYLNQRDIVEMQPEASHPDRIARVRVGETTQRSCEDAKLFQAIPRRRTNRLAFFDRPVSEEIKTHLAEAVRREGASLYIVEDGPVRAAVAQLVGKGVRALYGTPAFRGEMSEWFHPLQEGDTDSISHFSNEIGELLTHSGPLVSAVDGADLLVSQEQRFASEAPVLMVLGTQGDTREDWLIAGQALARLLLVAAANGINAAYLNQPIQVERLRPELQETVGIGEQPQLLLAMGYAPAVSPAPRRPMEDILSLA